MNDEQETALRVQIAELEKLHKRLNYIMPLVNARLGMNHSPHYVLKDIETIITGLKKVIDNPQQL